jgi:hypothetical protein
MSVTYESALVKDIHKVRFLIRDADISNSGANAALQDEEIEWILSEEENIYLAAAKAGEVAFLAEGKGISSATVAGISMSRGQSAEDAYRKYLDTLRKRGTKLLLPTDRPESFEVLSTSS